MASVYPGYYSLIQFCADVARGELGNVGIAVISPEQKQVRVLSGRSKFADSLIQESPLQESGASMVVDAFIDRLRATLQEDQTAKGLESFSYNAANPVSLSKAREMNIRDIEKDAQRLLQRLVL